MLRTVFIIPTAAASRWKWAAVCAFGALGTWYPWWGYYWKEGVLSRLRGISNVLGGVVVVEYVEIMNLASLKVSVLGSSGCTVRYLARGVMGTQ